MRLIIVLLFSLSLLQLKSQNGFLQSYDLGEVGLAFHNMLLVEDTLVLFGSIGIEDLEQWGLVFLKMDTLGNILDYRMHFDSLGDDYNFESNYKMVHTTDGGYALVGQMFSRQFPVLIKLDENGELEFVQEYPDATVFNIHHWNIIETANGYITLGVKQQMNDGYWDAFIMGTDKAGNKLWEISYGEYGVWDRLEGVQKLGENEYLITGETFISSSQIEDNADLWGIAKAIKIDTLGQTLWEWEGDIIYTGNSLPILSQLYKSPDGNWINRGATSTLLGENEVAYQAEVVKRDTNFNVIWNTTFGEPTSNRNHFSTLTPSPDGSWIVVGEYVDRPVGDPLGGYQAAMIAKVNADGDSLWSRIDTLFNHTMIASRPYLGGVVVLPSGSVIACGRVDKTYPAPQKTYGILIKVDKDGCMEPGCSPIVNSTNLTPLLEGFEVYPNPVKNKLTIYGKGNYNLQIIDENGRILKVENMIYEQSEVDMTHFPSGSYFLRLQQGNNWLMKKILKI